MLNHQSRLDMFADAPPTAPTQDNPPTHDATSLAPHQGTVRVNGIELAYFEHNAPQSDSPTLLFVHATGFHGRVWDKIIHAFPHHHALALELRGHGRSQKKPIDHWNTMGRDMAAFATELGLQNAIGIGHSVGAHAMVDAAAQTRAFARLVLLDPTIVAPAFYANPPASPGEPHPAARRRSAFASPSDMWQRLRTKGSYPLFDRQMFWDYCRYGLLPTANGDFVLACPPEVEAAVYVAARTNGAVFESVRSLEIPVLILRAKEPPKVRQPMDFASSPTWPQLVNEFAHGREIHLPQYTHFIPLQAPERVIAVIQDEVSAWRVAKGL